MKIQEKFRSQKKIFKSGGPSMFWPPSLSHLEKSEIKEKIFKKKEKRKIDLPLNRPLNHKRQKVPWPHREELVEGKPLGHAQPWESKLYIIYRTKLGKI